MCSACTQRIRAVEFSNATEGTTVEEIPVNGTKEFIALMAVLMSVVAISIDAMLPALGVIGHDLHVTDPNQAQYIISCIFAGLGLGELVCGPLSDALGRKRIIYGCIFLYLIGAVTCFFSTSIEMMLIGRFIQGIGVSGPYVSTLAIVRDKYEGPAMGRIMSLVMMIFIMTPAIAPSMGVGIITFLTWHYIFALYIVYALVVLTWVALRLEETLKPADRIPFSMRNVLIGTKEVLSHRAAVCYMVAAALVFGGLIGYLNSSQQIFQVHYNVGKAFALYFGGLALMFGISSMANARIVERLGMRYLSLRAIMAMVLGSAIFLGLNLMLDSIPLWMLLVYIASMFGSLGLLFGNLNALAMEPMGHIAGIASAVIGCISSIISIIFGTLIGQLYDDTLVPLTAGLLVASIGALLCMMVAKGAKA